MHNRNSNSIFPGLRPYLSIAVIAILAFLPISSTIYSLKNDVLGIEYPIQYFIGESIHNGSYPAWFNTWGMGFPLQSILSWSVFSTPQMILNGLFGSSLWVLHFEFILYIIASGCMMYKLLTSHFINDRSIALLLSCCYMLSGFTVGSSQWLLYLTALFYVPLMIHSLLRIFRTPSLKYSLLFAFSYFLLLTNVHVYLSLVTTYGLIFTTAALLFIRWKKIDHKTRLLKFLGIAAIITIILCSAPLYFTYELIGYLERAKPLEETTTFFQSNYLHAEAFSSVVAPLSVIKTSLPNTEGSVLNIYAGLLTLLLLPVSFVANKANRPSYVFLIISLIFLLISFGHLTPLRGWMNILPGLSHFRHPAVLRVFYILFLILFFGHALRHESLYSLRENPKTNRIILFTFGGLILIGVIIFVCNITSLPTFTAGVSELIRNLNDRQLSMISVIIQLGFFSILLLSWARKSRLFSYVLMTELIINTLLCTPFFTISSLPAKDIVKIYSPVKGFPIQQTNPYDVPSIINGERNTLWVNSNVFRKEVSANLSNPGPLIFEKILYLVADSEKIKQLKGKSLVSSNDPTVSIDVKHQRPSSVAANVEALKPATVTFLQANFPGWTAYYNGERIPVPETDSPFINVNVPAGKGELLFVFEKGALKYSSIFLHLLVILFFFIYLIKWRTGTSNRLTLQ